MSDKKVFVGVRTYNSSSTLDDTFSCLSSQTYPNMKIVVYDDKSTDDTLSRLKIWKNKLSSRGIEMDIIESDAPSNEGCAVAFEKMGRAVARQIGDDDIYLQIDSDDTFAHKNVVTDIVNQMEKNNANVCVIGYELKGDLNLAINWNNGTPHNKMSHRLAQAGAATVKEIPEMSSDLDSMGCTKILTGKLFKRYMDSYPTLSKDMNVCEDFPTLAMLLYKDAKITGLNENVYNYFKHPQSSTAQIVQPEAFKVVRIGFLKALQKMVKDKPEDFVENAQDHVNAFLRTKCMVISGIVDKKSKEGYLTGYTKADFIKDFHENIDCSKLNLPPELRYTSPEITNAIIEAKSKKK